MTINYYVLDFLITTREIEPGCLADMYDAMCVAWNWASAEPNREARCTMSPKVAPTLINPELLAKFKLVAYPKA